jgi:hemolysin D
LPRGWGWLLLGGCGPSAKSFLPEAINAIHVDDGDHVTAGQLLVDLDPTDIQTDLESLLYNQAQAALDAEVARILLTRDPNTSFNIPENVDPTLAEANHDQALNAITKHLAQIAGIESAIARQNAILEATNAQIERAQETLPLLTEKYDTALGPCVSQFEGAHVLLPQAGEGVT